MDNDDFPQWDQADPQGSLRRLFDWTVHQTQRQIDWYDRKRKPKRRFSQVLLVAALLLGGLGAVSPLIAAACKGCGISIADCFMGFMELGYILIALAGLVILFDRIFGFTAGWMRFMETQMKLQQMLDDFRFDWIKATARELPLEQRDQQLQELLTMLRNFMDMVGTLLMCETRGWIQEFQKNLTEIDKLAEKGKQ